MNSLSEVKFIKFQNLLGLKVATIMVGCACVISTLESLEHCANGGGVRTCGYVGSTQL